MRLEAHAIRSCRRAGLWGADVLADDDGTLLGTTGLVMRRVSGETIARRILRDDEFAAARPVLVGDLARFLAGLHAIDPDEVPGVEAPDPVEPIWAKYLRIDDRSITFEKTSAWLVAHSPQPR
jgi:aminoglycoside phosphotransferase (APT) family kinase protein